MMGLLASPDGRRLAYLLGYDTPTGRFDAELGVVTVGTSERKVLLKTTSPREAAINSPMAWSPDGRLLLYSRYAQPRVFNVETLQNWPLVQDAHQPQPNTDLANSLQRWGPTGEASWSPDGSFIVLTICLLYTSPSPRDS